MDTPFLSSGYCFYENYELTPSGLSCPWLPTLDIIFLNLLMPLCGTLSGRLIVSSASWGGFSINWTVRILFFFEPLRLSAVNIVLFFIPFSRFDMGERTNRIFHLVDAPSSGRAWIIGNTFHC